MEEPVTFPLLPSAAEDLRRAYGEPERVGRGLDEPTLQRVLDLVRAWTGADQACLSLAGRAPVGEALPLAANLLETIDAPTTEGELTLFPLRVPLLPSGRGASRTFGVLAIRSVATATPQLAAHVSTLLVEASLARLADIDPTTRLLTRAAFERRLAHASSRLADGEPATLVMIDVDDLRALNAVQGTRGGDALLRTLGSALAEEARGGGVACRYGGDELVLLLFGAPDGEAAAARVADVAKAAGGSISAGLANAPTQARTADELVLRADQALAHAKAQGKGRVATWDASLRRLPRRDRLAGVLTGDDARDGRNVQALLESVAAVSRLAPLDETLERIVDRCVELTDAARGLLLLHGDDGWTVRVARRRGAEPLEGEPAFAASVAQAALDEGRALSRLAEQAEVISRSAEALGVKAILCAPLAGEDVPAGVLYVDAPAAVERFDPSTIAFFGALTAGVATALRNAELYGRLLERAEQLQADVSGREAELARVKQLWARDCKARPDVQGYADLVGAAPAMQTLFAELQSLEDSSAPVVVLGESGTGKELVARAIHARSPRRKGPLVAVDCGAIPAALFESELFGHARGAFTGAHSDRAGLMEAAHGGTLFLDEVGELALDAQAKLLRALQEGELRRVGEATARKVDVRVVAATNRDLSAMVQERTFREDLYYRLAVFTVRVPALRERPADIPLLAQHTLGERALTPEAQDVLVRAPWPGNVRELQNVLERAATLAGEGPIGAEHVTLSSPERAAPQLDLFNLPFKDAKQAFAEEYARRLTEQEGGSVPAAAKRAGVSRQTFYRLLGRGG